MSDFRRFVLPVIAGLFVASTGCIGAVSPLSSGPSVSVTNVSIGPGHGLPSDPGPDEPGVDSPPRVESNDTHIIVTGEIIGIGDLNCLAATGSATTTANDTLELTIDSISTSPPDGCNSTAGFFTYRAVVTSDDPHPERISIQHMEDGGETNNWTRTIADGMGGKPTESPEQAEPMTTHTTVNRTE